MYKIIADSSPFAEKPFDKTEQIFDFIGKYVLLQFFILEFVQRKSTSNKKKDFSIHMDFMPTSIVSFCCQRMVINFYLFRI